jgi:hypothetical protein
MGATLQRRALVFTDWDSLLADVERLHIDGYDRLGNWELAQMCDHLSLTLESSLDGFAFKVPWIVRATFGPFLLRRVIKTGRMGDGIKVPEGATRQTSSDATAAVERFRRAVERVRSHTGPFQPHPLVNRSSADDWRQIHFIHCAHHLSLLVPRAKAPAATS